MGEVGPVPNKSSKVGFIKSELIIFRTPTKIIATVAIMTDKSVGRLFFLAYHIIKRPVIDKCQISKISTSKVSVFFITIITILTISMINKK